MLGSVRVLSMSPGECGLVGHCSHSHLLLFSAQQHGLLCEVDSEEEAGSKEICDPFFAHCKAHADKDVAKRKVSLCSSGISTWHNYCSSI